MARPAFLTELDHQAFRAKQAMGVPLGYGMAAAYGLLALAAQIAGIIPWSWSFYALVAAKFATNTAYWFALKRDRAVMDVGGLNVIVDIVVITGAIYLTGGQLSPLFAFYVIEIAVIALLTNVGVTAIVAGLSWTMYAAMAVLVHTGVLPQQPAPVLDVVAEIPASYLGINLALGAVMLAIPALLTGMILRLLRAKERALEERTRELVAANEQKSRFLANITHELRTPVSGIVGLSDLVLAGIYGPVTDKQREAHEGIQRNAASQLQLIDELLHLSRAEIGPAELRASRVELPALVEGAVSSARFMIGTKDLQVRTDLEAVLPPLYIDRAKLTQILVNLLSNAVKFTPEGGHITVRARRDGVRQVKIQVIDTGIGIPEDQVDRIFEEFQQLDTSTRREHGGIGLGLALTKRLVALLGGELDVTSEVGVGSTFTVTVPVGSPPDEGSVEEPADGREKAAS